MAYKGIINIWYAANYANKGQKVTENWLLSFYIQELLLY